MVQDIRVTVDRIGKGSAFQDPYLRMKERN